MLTEVGAACSGCGHVQQDGKYCETCGMPLASGKVLATQTSASKAGPSPSSRRFISVPLDVLLCFGVVVVGALVSGATQSITPFFLMLILGLGYAFLVRKWLRLASGIPGARLIGAGMLASLLTIVSFVLWLFRMEDGPPAYVFIIALCLAVVLFVAAWYAREHAKRVAREIQLLAHVEKLQTGPSAGRTTAATVSPPLASNLSELVAMLDRGLLTPEEFQVAKRRLLASESSRANDGD